MSTPYGYALLFDELDGNGDLRDWTPIYIVTQRSAEHDQTTIEAEIERKIRWEVETCGRKPSSLAVVEVSKPIVVRGKLKNVRTFTNIKYKIGE